MSTLQALRAARARLNSPENWCQGRGTLELKDGGHAFCMIGACSWHTGDTYGAARDALARVLGITPGPGCGAFIGDWNDSHTHEEVLEVFDWAIENELAREQEFTACPAGAVPDVLPV